MHRIFSASISLELLEKACHLHARNGEDTQIFVSRFRACRDLIVGALRQGWNLPESIKQNKVSGTSSAPWTTAHFTWPRVQELSLMTERARRLAWAQEHCVTRALPNIPVMDSWVLVSMPHNITYCQLEKVSRSRSLSYCQLEKVSRSRSLSYCQLEKCVICHTILSNDALRPGRLERHLSTNHKALKEKPKEFFTAKLHELNRMKLDSSSVFHQETWKLVEASYELSLLIAKVKKPHSLGETLVNPAF
ncbi:hypothetical protein FHG87_013330 [Trinorchestia longiramus]|nr:hypothetical protein FHG87_013330 [Trinorchestia longiramus]